MINIWIVLYSNLTENGHLVMSTRIAVRFKNNDQQITKKLPSDITGQFT